VFDFIYDLGNTKCKSLFTASGKEITFVIFYSHTEISIWLTAREFTQIRNCVYRQADRQKNIYYVKLPYCTFNY